MSRIEYIVDTNVPLVANGASAMSGECLMACIEFLGGFSQEQLTLVIDDKYLILGEYLHALDPKRQPGVGDSFLRWVLTNLANPERVKLVSITPQPPSEYDFAEFPATLEPLGIDNSDKKFVAVAKANDGNAPIAQASDSKWIGWVTALEEEGIRVGLLCEGELTEIFHRKIG